MISTAAASDRVCGELVFNKELQWRGGLLIKPVAHTKVTPVRLLCRLDVSTKMSRSIAVNEQDGYSFYLV